jgi:hypothetical protein
MAMAIARALRMNPTQAPLPDAPSFSGDKDSDLTCFLKSFENCSQLNGWSGRMKIQIFKTKLVSNAASVLHRLPDDVQNDMTLLIDALKNRYQPKAKTELYQMQFSERKQKKNESLSDLCENIKRLADKAYPMMNDPRCREALDQLCNNQFVDAIFDNDLRNKVRMWRKSTLDETLTEALRLEGVLYKEHQEQKSTTRSKQTFGNTHFGASDIQLTEQPYSFAFQRAQNDVQPAATRGNACYACGGPGHRAVDCISNGGPGYARPGQFYSRYGQNFCNDARQYGDGRNGGGRNGGGRDGQRQPGQGGLYGAPSQRHGDQNYGAVGQSASKGACYHCGQAGHFKRNCPQVQPNLNC